MVPEFDVLRTARARRGVSKQGDLLIERIDDVEPFGQMMRI